MARGGNHVLKHSGELAEGDNLLVVVLQSAGSQTEVFFHNKKEEFQINLALPAAKIAFLIPKTFSKPFCAPHPHSFG